MTRKERIIDITKNLLGWLERYEKELTEIRSKLELLDGWQRFFCKELERIKDELDATN